MRRKHLLIGLLALLLGSIAAIAFILPSQSGSGSAFAFLPNGLTSVFKKPDAPSNNTPPAPGPNYGGSAYQPLDISELPALPTDLPITEGTETGEGNDTGTSPPSGGPGFAAKGGSGNSQTSTGNPNSNSDGGFGGGAGGGGGGGGGGGSDKSFKTAMLTTPPTDECTVNCEEQQTACTENCEQQQPECTVNCEEQQTVCTENCEEQQTVCTENCGEQQTACTENCEEQKTDGCTVDCGEKEIVENPGDSPCGDGILADAECLPPSNDTSNPNTDTRIVAVDEPGTLSLLLVGGLGLWLARRARRKAA